MSFEKSPLTSAIPLSSPQKRLGRGKPEGEEARLASGPMPGATPGSPGRRPWETMFLVLLLAALPVAAAAADDWPGFRGPQRDGVSTETGLLRAWPEGGPKELWRVPLGEGFSGIAVVGERLYTLFVDGGAEYAAAFRVADGKEIWRRKLDEKFVDAWGNGPRATPTVADGVEGGVVYAVSSFGQLVALKASDGTELWRFDYNTLGPIVDPYTIAGAVPPGEEKMTGKFGHSSSPLVVGDLLVTYPGAMPEKAMALFDRHRGELLWTGLANGSGHTSPQLVEIGGRRQVVQILPNEILALDPATREVLWRHPWAIVTVAQPVFVPPDKIFAATVNDHGGELFRVIPPPRDGAPYRTESLWKVRTMRNSWNSSIYHDGYLYGFDNATLRCLDAESGELQWAKRGYGKGTLTLADGLLFVFTDRGVVHMAAATPEGFTPTGTVKVFEDGPTWTATSVAGGRMFLRNTVEIVALALSPPTEGSHPVGAAPRGRPVMERTRVTPGSPPGLPKGTRSGAGRGWEGAAPPFQKGGVGGIFPGIFALLFTAVASQDLTTEIVLQRANQAFGGDAAWAAIDTLEMTGDHTSFSIVQPFTLQKKRPNLWRFDHNDTHHRSVHAFDGQQAWWQKAVVVQSQGANWPVEPPATFQRVFAAEAEFDPPMIRWREKGHRFEYLGVREVDLEPYLELRLIRGDGAGAEERWLLDPETYLPAIRLAEGAYLPTKPWEQRTYFFDYREVAGVWIPHGQEIDLGNDLRALEVTQVRINEPLDDALFALPLPAGMAPVQSLVGEWQVQVESRPLPIMPWIPSAGRATIRADFGGALLTEELEFMAVDFPWNVRRQISWDRFREVYRIAVFDNFSHHLDLREGRLEDGRLIASNLETQTPWIAYDRTQFTRDVLSDITDDAFHRVREISLDGGATWQPAIRFQYTRKEPTP